MKPITTNDLIERMVDSLCDHSASERQLYLLRQSLLALVRLAKIEHQAEIKKDVAKATRLSRVSESRRTAKKLLESFAPTTQACESRPKYD